MESSHGSATLGHSFVPGDRANAGGLNDHGLATASGRLLARLGRLIDNPPPLDDAECFAAHLTIEFPAIFTLKASPSPAS